MTVVRSRTLNTVAGGLELHNVDVLLDATQVAQVIGVSRNTIYRRIDSAKEKGGLQLPEPVHGAGPYRWRYSDVLRWLDTRPLRRDV